MKKWLVRSIGLAMVGFLTAAMASPIEDAIIERIKKAGSVCLQGEACAGQAVAQTSSSGAQDPQAIYDRSCATCHAMGIAGAPAWADVDAWAPRIEKGMDVLYASGINGLGAAMPAKGMCFDCSDDDIKAVVDLMVSVSQ